MKQVSEITVIIKGGDSTLKKKFLCYEQILLDPNDAFLRVYIDEAKAEFQAIVEEIKIKISMEV